MSDYLLDKKQINICMLGHVGHGKTTLVSAIGDVLTKYKIVQHVSVGGNENTLFVKCQMDITDFFIDCPSDNFKSIITNLAMSDIAILVVDISEDIMPQTRDHILYAKQCGIPNIVVFMNKCDMLDASIDASNIHKLLNTYGFDGDNAPIIYGSALKALEGDTTYEQSIIDLIKTVHMTCLNIKDEDLKKTK